MPDGGSWPETVPVTEELARGALNEVQQRLPERWRLMPIGGTYMGLSEIGQTTTKDVDMVVGAIQEDASIPSYDEILSFAEEQSPHVRGRKDHTSVRFVIYLDAGPVDVEIIRGRTPGKGGYFVSRSILEGVMEAAETDGGFLWPPPEGLAFLKAWAAHDKQKLADAGKDTRGYHRNRREAFLEDVRSILDALLERGDRPEENVFEELFDRTGGPRESAVRSILQETGWIQG